MDSVTYTISDLHFGYGKTNILHGLDLTFEPGTLHAIIGPNGSGKSTLLDLMAGYQTPSSGLVQLNGTAIHDHPAHQLARLAAMVPQRFDFNFPFTVFDAVLMGRHPHIPRFSRPSGGDLDMVRTALKKVDMIHLKKRTLAELSGGEKQRTVLARALAQDTPGLLLDEPTSSMDIRHALSAMFELKRLAHENGRTVIAVLHDLNLAAAYSDRIVILKNGQAHAAGNPADVLTPEMIQDVFGVAVTITRHPKSDGLSISYNIEDTP